ncbi:peptidase S10 [Telmatobacter sp. DSM 110680]|uniref:Peptidase S10 n=1 Tax=Telmatobacter sp. DSM 110680 TaxID=3036704 RepID=A0AAU7DGP1_9BACT
MQVNRLLGAAALAAALLPWCSSARADDDNSTKKPDAAEKVPPSEATTQSTIDVGNQHIAYTSIAGTITVGATDADDAQLGMDGKPLAGSQLAISAPKEAKDAPPVARMFYVAYFKKDVKAEDRPVTFFYNGGPGSSTVWLHMGSLGPKHVVTGGDSHLPAAPYKMVDNANSLIDVSDLVFIDAPGTGFGRLIGKDAEKAFWGVDQDGGAFARFIARFITKYGRWNSPKFIFGESYGTTRSAVLVKMLGDRQNIDLNGVILLSQVFNFTSDIDGANLNPGIDLSYILALPTYAATAWYHKKVSPQPAALDPFLKEVEDFAVGPYLRALTLGTDLSDAERQSVAEKLHAYTGLPVAYLLKANLRVNGGEFEKAFADDLDLTIGRLDTRFTGPSLNPLSESADYDPQSAAISSAYVSLFNSYIRKDLKYGEDQTYFPSADVFGGGSKWDFKHGDNSMVLNVSNDLADAMKTNPHLKVMLNGGYYDLATPFFAAQYEEKHLPIPPSLAKNIEYSWYESGHMVYVHDGSLKQLHDRVSDFIKATVADSKQ